MPEADAEAGHIPHFSDPERAREAGRLGGLRAQEKARLRKEDPEKLMRDMFALKSEALSRELLDAALGQGAWHDLSLEKRLAAVTKALEYAVGRPTARKDDEKPAATEEPGLTLQ